MIRLLPQYPTARFHSALRRLLGRDWLIAYVLMAPTLFIMGGLIAYPFMRALYISFTRTHGREIGPFVGLANYLSLWEDRFFREAVAVTIRYTASSMLQTLLIALLAATLLHRIESQARWLTALILLPWVMPEIVRAITWKSLLDPLYGGVNRALIGAGLIQRGYPFFGDYRTALSCVVLVNVWQRVPFFVINLLAGLKAVDNELYEAASMDGASAWRKFLHVTLPSIRSVIAVVLLLGTIWSFNEFSLILLLTGGGPMNATKMYSVLAYQYAGRRMGAGVAVAMSMAPIFVALVAILGRRLLSQEHGDNSRSRPERELIRFWRKAFGRWRRAAMYALGLLHDAIEQGVTQLGRWAHKLAAHGDTPRRRRARVDVIAAIALAALLAFELLPFYWVVITAFKTELQITRFETPLWPQPWSLDQFRRLFGPGRNFAEWLQNTLLLSVVTPALATLIAAAGAYALARLRWRGAGVVARAVLISYLMPTVLIVMPIYHLFTWLKLINTRVALILSYPALTLPFATWLLMGYYASIPNEIEDAARIDGCDYLRVLWRVILPLSKPALLAVALFGVTQAWNEYILAYTFIISENKWTIPLGLAQMIFGDVVPWGELSAAALLMALPVLAMYALGQRFMVAGLTAGAVRGNG